MIQAMSVEVVKETDPKETDFVKVVGLLEKKIVVFTWHRRLGNPCSRIFFK